MYSTWLNGVSNFTGRSGGVDDSNRSREKNAITRHSSRKPRPYLNHVLIVLGLEDLAATGAACVAGVATATTRATIEVFATSRTLLHAEMTVVRNKDLFQFLVSRMDLCRIL